jgi:hypothetical protein
MLWNKLRFSSLFAILLATFAIASAPASANATFDYKFVQTSGPDKVTGTLVLVMKGGTNLSDLGIPAQGNIPLSDIVSFEFVLNGVTFDFTTTGKNIVALQFDDNKGDLRDITFSGTSTGSAYLTSTSIFQFLPTGHGTYDNGNFVFVSSADVVVPEPSSLWLMLSGLAMLLIGFAFRNRAVAAWAGFAPNR